MHKFGFINEIIGRDKITERQKQMLICFWVGFVVGIIFHRILVHVL